MTKMARIFIFVLNFFFIVLVKPLYAELGRPERTIELKKPPTEQELQKLSPEEAEQKAREAQEQYDLADKREKEAKERRVEIIRNMNTYKTETIPNELNDQFAQANLDVAESQSFKEGWLKVQNSPVIEKAAKALGVEIHVVTPIKTPEPTWWQTVANTIKTTWTKLKLTAVQIFGSKEQVIAVRNELNDIYRDLGVGGILDKARNTAQTAKLLDDLQDRITTHIGALQEYKNALDQGAVPETEQINVVNEIEQTISDLLVARDSLLDVNLSADDRNKIVAEIDVIIRQLVPNDADRTLLFKQSGIVTNPQEIQNIITMVREQVSIIPDRIRLKPLDFMQDPQYRSFMTNLRMLERVNVNMLTDLTDRVALKMVIRNGYEEIKNSIWNQIIENKTLNPDMRQRLLDRWISLNDKYIQTERLFAEQYDNFITTVGIDKVVANPDALSNQKLLNQVDNMLKNVANIIANEKNFANPTEMKSQYDKWSKIVDKQIADLNEKPVNDISLQIKQNVLDNFYTKLIDNINEFTEKGILGERQNIATPEIGLLLLDIMQKIQKLSADLVFDRSILATIKEGSQDLQLVRQEDRPFNSNNQTADLDKIEYVKKVIPYLSLVQLEAKYNDPSTDAELKSVYYNEMRRRQQEEEKEAQIAHGNVQQELLQAIKGGPARLNSAASRGDIIKNPTIQEKLQQDLQNVVLKKVQVKGPLEPKDWWAAYLTTGK